jgi:tetratricopeptide (TPR) repeat protein
VKPITGQPTILLADADLEALDKNAILLQELGLFNHLQAESGTEAMAMIKNFRPELLIVSQDLPDISGLSILSLVRQQELDEERSIVIVYGQRIDDRTMAKLGRIGVDSVLACPYPAEDFKRQVSEILNQDLDPKVEKAEKLQERCQVLIDSGKFEEALQTCQDIIEIDANAEVYYNMGYILSMRGHFEEAIKSFRKATLINNQHARAFKQMGLVYQKLGRIEDAQGCLEHAAELHMTLNQENEAEEIFNTVLALRPDTTNVYNSLGIIYRRQGRLDESLKAYQKAVLVHPDDEHIFFNMARCQIDLDMTAEARQALKRAIELNPGFVPARDLLRAIELGLKLKP